MMELTPKTKVLQLIRSYDFMLDYLVAYAPEFKKLKNPVMRNTVGRFATLEMAASMADRPLERLLADIQRVIRDQTGQELPLTLEGGSGLDPERIRVLKEIIQDLHQGASMDELKRRFAELLEDVSPAEIAQMEQQLIAEGLPQAEVKRLCDVHVQVFKESLDRQEKPSTPAGHPVHTFQAENRALRQAAERLTALLAGPGEGGLERERDVIGAALEQLGQVELHYQRKENQLFPLLERRGVVGPSQVMWAIHDDVRTLLKQAVAALAAGDEAELGVRGRELCTTVVDMIYKEDNILFPMALQVLRPEDWGEVRRGEEEIGFALGVRPGSGWQPPAGQGEATNATGGILDQLPLDTGLLGLEMINLMLKHLPLDLSLVDEEDRVVYYSDTAERIFPRSPGVIGRKVQLCHPQKSVHMVQAILDAFRAGDKDVAEFWIQMRGRFLHIRYFAVRDASKKYRGCLEVSQDVTAIRALEGERRLLDWGAPAANKQQDSEVSA